MGYQAHRQDQFWGGAGPPKVDLFGPKKWTFGFHPLNYPTKPNFWLILWLIVDLLEDLGWCVTPSAPPPPLVLHEINYTRTNMYFII